MDSTAKELVRGCGGVTNAIHLLATTSRAFWQLSLRDDPQFRARRKRDLYRRTTYQDLLMECERAEKHLQAPGVHQVLSAMESVELLWRDREAIKYKTVAHNAIAFTRTLMHGVRPEQDLRYFVWRDIRRFYGLTQSAETAHHVHSLSSALNSLIFARRVSPAFSTTAVSEGVSWDLQNEVMPALREQVNEDFSIPIRTIDFFLEACRAVGYIRVSDKLGGLDIRAQEIDPEYLLSQLFGIPTSIKGLDDLFGGGGLMLVEDVLDKSMPRVGGRAVLSIGPFGTGKSLFALQMAVEVARKGGAAWLMPMEQSPEECLYALESMGSLPEGSPITIANTVPKAIDALEHPDPEKGALILIRTVKDAFDDFAVAFEENERLMRKYSMRLLIVDPINAISQNRRPSVARSKMLGLFESVKSRGTNIWLVGEERGEGDTQVEQSIADTVIHLRSQVTFGYCQRYVEITKSRLQREQRGMHDFSIGPGLGITVYPSSAAYRSKLQKRALRRPDTPISLGFPALDLRIGEASLFSGDVVVLQGPSGSGKSVVAMSFLLSADLPNTPDRSSDVTMLVTNTEAEYSARHQLETVYQELRRTISFNRPPDRVHIVGVPGGYVKPGYILQRIEAEFENARQRGFSIVRVVIDNVVKMELGCPFIAADETFGDTLVDLVRKRRVTSLFVCREAWGNKRYSLQNSIISNADCLVQFAFQSGTPQLEVKKTRGMRHKRGPIDFDIA